LLAKLATKRAKPNGIFHLSDSEAVLFIRNLDVGELPGIGWSMQRKLQEHFNVKTCQELSGIPLRDLKTKFGEKTAEKMMQYAFTYYKKIAEKFSFAD
jgi:DNA repair protein REV1